MKRKIDFQKTLRDIATTMVRLKRPERLLKLITRLIDREFGLIHTSLLLFDENNKRFIFLDSKGRQRFPINLIRVDLDHPLVTAFQRERGKSSKSVFKEDYFERSWLKKHTLGSGDTAAEALKLLKSMDLFKAELVLPGYYKQKLLGMLLLGKKKSGRAFTSAEIEFFQVVVQDCSMALKVSEYHRSVTEKNKELENRLEEIEGLRKKEHSTYYEIMRSLAQEVHAKDPYTFGHVGQVERLGMMTAREMGLDLSGRKKDILSAGLILHDVGKIGIPDAILKKKARLDDEEWKIMRTHSEKGAKILEHLTDFKEVAEIVHCHHEYYDGKGYPRGLKGEDIPIQSRIISVVDAFHAIVSTRCYSQGRPVEVAFEELKRCAGSQFDPQVVDAFIAALKREMKKRGVGFFLDEKVEVAA
jgi:HD-GYP domain-containing protein (c-di-GMP phosphodiesterase class II)